MSRLLRWLSVPAFIVLLAAAAMPGVASAQEAERPSITVRGQGVVSVRPDLAFVTMGASVRRETAAAAFEQANALVAQLNQILRDAGVPERDVQTRQFSLSPEFGRSTGDGPAPIVGWRAVNLLSIKIRDFGRIGAIIDAGARALGNDAQISGITFTVEDTDAVARQARDQAIANARERAQQMAAAAGVRIVRVLSITETSAPPPTPVALAAPAPGVAAAAAPRAAEVAPGEQNITVTVEMVFEIE